MSRLRKFVVWFLTFGLSFLAAEWGLAEQGKAFFFTSLGIDVVMLFILLVLVLIAAISDCDINAETLGLSVISILCLVCEIAVVIFATWGATKLFPIDFFTAYQIMTFGQCLCITGNKKDD